MFLGPEVNRTGANDRENPGRGRGDAAFYGLGSEQAKSSLGTAGLDEYPCVSSHLNESSWPACPAVPTPSSL